MPHGFDYLMWSLTLVLAAAAILRSTFWTTDIFGWKPTVIFEFLLYSSSSLTSYPVIGWNIYK